MGTTATDQRFDAPGSIGLKGLAVRFAPISDTSLRTGVALIGVQGPAIFILRGISAGEAVEWLVTEMPSPSGLALG